MWLIRPWDPVRHLIFSRKARWCFRNDQAAVEQLIAKATATATTVRWAVDLTSAGAALLLALLIAAGQRVVYVPGTVVNRMSDTFTGEAKTDLLTELPRGLRGGCVRGGVRLARPVFRTDGA